MNKDIFYRTKLLTGEEGIAKLKNSSVAVIGLGGVGAYALEAVARAGVEKLVIVDHDIIEESNINRQLPALNSTIGLYKTDIMEKRLKDINPAIEIRKYTLSFNTESSEEILSYPIDYVIDAIDALADKIHLIKCCIEKEIPLICAMGTANRINPLKLKVADISETSICPMARKLRRELRKENIVTGVKVVYSEEKPLQTRGTENEHLGSISYVPSVAGLIMASTVINDMVFASGELRFES